MDMSYNCRKVTLEFLFKENVFALAAFPALAKVPLEIILSRQNHALPHSFVLVLLILLDTSLAK